MGFHVTVSIGESEVERTSLFSPSLRQPLDTSYASMPTAPKKSTTKASTKASAASKSSTHPSWIDMIKVCHGVSSLSLVSTPSASLSLGMHYRTPRGFQGGRLASYNQEGRPQDPRCTLCCRVLHVLHVAQSLTPSSQFVESKYKVELNASTASQLNRAITSGSERGTFVLPKGTGPYLSSSLIFLMPDTGPSGKVKLTPKVRGEATKEVSSSSTSSSP